MATLYEPDNLRDIKMKCDDEIEYNAPKNMINERGEKRYAYVTLIMLGDLYISAAITLAYSLRLLKTGADLVVLTTPDVSNEGKRILRMYFDKIKEIEYVTIKNWRSGNKENKQYLNLVFTKFNIFNLTEYEKIILIDADALILKHPDHLFTLEAPAGCFLEDKNLFITYDESGNYILPKDGKIKWYDEYCKCCGHGKKIPKYMTDRLYKNYNNSGIGGGLMLLEPKEGEFDNIIKDVSEGKMNYLISKKLVWPEQQYLTLRYSGKWTMINPVFFGLQGYPHYSKLFGLQYGGEKPFVIYERNNIEVMKLYPDFILWHEYYSKILSDNPELMKSESLKIANDINKTFRNNKMSRNVIYNNVKKIDTTLIKNISDIYNISEKRIKSSVSQYFFINYDMLYRPISYSNIMFDNIDEYDYLKPIKLLNDYHKNNNDYYKKISEQIVIEKSNKRLNEYNFDEIDRDNIMLQYIKCRKKIFVITIWNIGISKFNEFVKELDKMGNIYYTKIRTMSKKAIRNMMYWMYDEFRIKDKLEFIEKKLDYTSTKEYDNKIGFIYFDNIKDYNISGQNAKFKREIRNLLLNMLKIKDLRGNDVIHINDHFYQAIEYSQLILNNNSMDMLEQQDVRQYDNKKMKLSNIKCQTMRKWIYENLSYKEIDRFLCLGSILLYAYSVRPCNDIDGIVGKRYMDSVEHLLERLIYDDLNNKATRIYFSDFGLIDSGHWRESWTEKNNEILKIMEISNSDELIYDPRNHLYFNGLKIAKKEFELVRKIMRSGKQDYADILMMYLYHRSMLDNHVLMVNNKLKINDKYNRQFIIPNDDFTNFIKKLIDQRYPEEITNKIDKKMIEQIFI